MEPWRPSRSRSRRRSRSRSPRSRSAPPARAGPGGQHAQKTETRVEAVFDVEGSTALGEAERGRLLARLGPVVRAVAQDERSQARNRELALERLTTTLAEALAAPAPAPDEADEGLPRGAARRQAPARPTKRLRRPPSGE